MKKYEYLVAYNFQRDGYLGTCTGSSQILTDKKIKSYADIIELNKIITKSIEGSSNLGIYNFILLGKIKVKKGK